MQMSDEPVTLQQVKMHLRLGSASAEDSYLMILITAARRAIENMMDQRVEALADEDKDVVAQASLLLIGHWYANREAVGVNVSEIPFAVQWLINPLRVMSV
jgi:hypothetical protein